MKIVYSKKFETRYPTNPVENPDRVKLSALELKGYKFVEPQPASLEDISRVHGRDHIRRVKSQGIFEAASLAAGGACLAADLAMEGEPSFALIRPPGHHASYNRSWGLCFFNNMAIAMRRIKDQVGKILIIDIDLHFGDGTVGIFRGDNDVKIVNIGAIDIGFEYLKLDRSWYLDQVAKAFQQHEFEIVGISAGFDTYVEDWGGLLTTEDYCEIGKIIREGADQFCEGRRFALLEGGYHPDLRYNVKSFVQGFE
ncbi:MAG: histone deacetylase family protein [Methanotrichaceae archaeon]